MIDISGFLALIIGIVVFIRFNKGIKKWIDKEAIRVRAL